MSIPILISHCDRRSNGLRRSDRIRHVVSTPGRPVGSYTYLAQWETSVHRWAEPIGNRCTMEGMLGILDGFSPRSPSHVSYARDESRNHRHKTGRYLTVKSWDYFPLNFHLCATQSSCSVLGSPYGICGIKIFCNHGVFHEYTRVSVVSIFLDFSGSHFYRLRSLAETPFRVYELS